MSTRSPVFSDIPLTIRSGSRFSTLKTVKVYQDRVKVTRTEGRIWGNGRILNEWAAPISEYTGVLRQSNVQVESAGQEGSEVNTYHELVLVHPDKRKSINLYWSENEANTHRQWMICSRWLQLPALYESGDGIVSLSTEDVGKTVRQLAGAGKLSIDFDAEAPPPRGIVVEQGNGYQRVSFEDDLSFLKRYIVVTSDEISYYLETPLGIRFQEVFNLATLLYVDQYDAHPSFWFRDPVNSLNWSTHILWIGLVGWASGHRALVEIIPVGLKSKITVKKLNNEQSHWLKNFILAAAIGRA